MKKVIYLHGLESTQGGPKVEFLSENSFVYAPSMNYHTFTLDDFHDLLSKVNDGDVIIGSSAGGYMADLLGSYKNCELLLFNPALHSRSFELPDEIEYGPIKSKRTFVLGLRDDVINPHITMEMLRKDDVIITNNMAHHTPLFVFKDIYIKHILGE